MYIITTDHDGVKNRFSQRGANPDDAIYAAKKAGKIKKRQRVVRCIRKKSGGSTPVLTGAGS